MKKNVGSVDRLLRFILGLFLVWLGIFFLNGKEGSIIGIAVSATSLLPFYMVITQSCFVFRWTKFHSFSKKEFKKHGDPYS